MNLRDALKKYHPEYKEDKEGLNYAENAIKEFRTRTASETVSGEFRGNLFSKRFRTIGESLARRYIEEGGITFIGEEIKNPAQLAIFMQAYRNPLFETIRFIYMKEQKVVAVEGCSNHLPSLVSLPYERSDIINHLKEIMTALDADGFYVTHNHPTGNPTPSIADQGFTFELGKNIPEFLGHIITNHSKYALLDTKGDYDILPMQNMQEDILAHINIEHPLLGKEICNSEDVAEMGKFLEIQGKLNMSCLLYTSAKGQVRMIQEVTNETFEDLYIKECLRQEMYSVGAEHAYCVTSDFDFYDKCNHFIFEKYFRDVIYLDPDYPFYWSKHEQGIYPESEYLGAGIKKSNLDYFTTFDTRRKR